MSIFRMPSAGLLLTSLIVLVQPVAADSVHLVNGDVLNGKVLSLDEKQLCLKSETLGQVNIPRAKVESITLNRPLHQRPPEAPSATPPPQTSGRNLTPEDALKQLKTTGVSPKDMGDLKKMFPQLATPEASKYFDDTVKGLLGGTRTIGDVRKDAMRARDELKKATRGLGPDVDAAVAPYLQILDGFIRETQPAPAKKEKALTDKK